MDEPLYITSDDHRRERNDVFARRYGEEGPGPAAEPALPVLPRPLAYVRLNTARRTADGVVPKPGDTLFRLDWGKQVLEEDNTPHAWFTAGMVIVDPFDLFRLVVVSRPSTGGIVHSGYLEYWYADPRKAIAAASRQVATFVEKLEKAFADSLTLVFERELERRKDWTPERQEHLVGYLTKLKEQTDPSV